MAEQSSLDEALARIVGTMPNTALTTPAASVPGFSPVGTSANVGQTSPYTPPPVATAPVAPAPVAPPVIAPTPIPTPAPALAPTPAPTTPAAVAPAASTAPAEPTMISRQALYDRQRQEQQDAYMASYNQQVAALPPGIKPGPTPTFSGPGPTNFTADYGGEMIANPYYTAPAAPITGREFLSGKGLTRAGVLGMARPERQALRGEFESTRSPSQEAMNRVVA